MTITKAGFWQHGTPTAGSDGREHSLTGYEGSFRAGTSDAYHHQFHNANGAVGRIRTGDSTTTYNTSSDYRLKENINYTWDATPRLKQLKPAQFSFIVRKDETIGLESGDNLTLDGTNGSSANAGGSILYEEGTRMLDGFIAHEVTDIVSAAVSGDKDAEDMQAIDNSMLVPLLVKTIQELEARITALEA